MVEAVTRSRWTPAEYLAMERASREKHSFFRGEIFAMSGGSRRHSLLAANVVGELREALRDRPCEVHTSDMRVKVQAAGLYTYPDVSALCGLPKFEDEHEDTLLNLALIVEVLSESTESYDRGKKFESYRLLSSLGDYVLVSQDEVLVEHFARQADGSWLLRELRAGDVLKLATLGCEAAVDEIYLKVFAKVGLEPSPPASG
jgi:Uma2 family endonuclease